tara:strand:- start:525 stop:836 length:312 start_codon:yes stop_codon:yes gene_type:complete
MVHSSVYSKFSRWCARWACTGLLDATDWTLSESALTANFNFIIFSGSHESEAVAPDLLHHNRAILPLSHSKTDPWDLNDEGCHEINLYYRHTQTTDLFWSGNG